MLSKTSLREAGRPPLLSICVTLHQINTNDPAQLPLLKAGQPQLLIDLLHLCGNVIDIIKTIYIENPSLQFYHTTHNGNRHFLLSEQLSDMNPQSVSNCLQGAILWIALQRTSQTFRGNTNLLSQLIHLHSFLTENILHSQLSFNNTLLCHIFLIFVVNHIAK